MKIKNAILITMLMFFVGESNAFWPWIHTGKITRPVLEQEGFESEAIWYIGTANSLVDIHQFSPQLHADDNMLGDASFELRERRKSVIEKLKACDGDAAREHFGQALHTVQDIYSHSNAVDDGLEGLLSGDLILNHLSNSTADCIPILLGVIRSFNSSELVTGYFGGQPDDVPFQTCTHTILNKDGFPSNDGLPHFEAVQAAKAGTLNYLNLI